MIQFRLIISIAMVHSVCDGKGDCSTPCVMGSWTAWPTVSQDKKVVQKSVFLMKRSRSAIRLFWCGWPADFTQLVLLFCAKLHYRQLWYIHEYGHISGWPCTLVIWFYSYKLSFTGTLICLFGCECILLESSLISVLCWFGHCCWCCSFVWVFWGDLNGFRWFCVLYVIPSGVSIW